MLGVSISVSGAFVMSDVLVMDGRPVLIVRTMAVVVGGTSVTRRAVHMAGSLVPEGGLQRNAPCPLPDPSKKGDLTRQCPERPTAASLSPGLALCWVSDSAGPPHKRAHADTESEDR